MVTVRTRKNIFTRLKESIGGIVFGLLLFMIAFPVLFMNEGRAVKTAKALTEGAAAVVSINASDTSAASDGALVHLSGQATTDEVLRDPVFGAEANALVLRRKVEMFQWVESSSTRTEERLGGTEERVTTYSYAKQWAGSHQDSSRFQQSAGHQNPPSMPYSDERFRAETITVGAFNLGDGLKSQLSGAVTFPAQEAMLEALPAELRQRAQISAGNLFISENPNNPAIGDLKISFEVINPATVSVVAATQNNTLVEYTTSNGRQLAMLSMGTHTADSMFEAAQQANVTMTWILRFLGFLMMFFGISMIFRPLSVMASIIPFMGKIVGAGTSLVAGGIAAFFALITIAIGWIVYRPLLGILLLVVASAIVGGIFFLIKKAKAPPAPAEADMGTV